MILFVLVLFSWALAPVAGWLGRKSSPLLAAIPALLFAAFCAYLPRVGEGAHVLETYRWIPSLGVEASFRIDGLSLLFALLITGIGTAVFLYAASYLRGQEQVSRFYVVLSLFMGSMIGAVLADDLVLLVVFWELTSLTSFLLIGFSPEQAEARRAAQQGFLITVAGGLALLAGVILLGAVAGTYSLTQILSRGETIAAHPQAPTIMVLLALGAFAKSAQAPLHSWLANAMVAPTPVSAYLHSATMVKLGIYLLARFKPVFAGHDLWGLLLTTVGLTTMLVGALLALRETDLKRVLAYSTIVSLGTLIMLIGVPGEIASIAVIVFLLTHALYKACLFLVTGIIDHETGTRDSSALGGLHRRMPVTATAAWLGALSLAGFPPFLGFVAKELVYETGLLAAPWFLVGTTLLANAVLVVVAGILTARCFLGDLTSTPKTPHDPGFALLAGPVLLALAGFVFGLAPGLVGNRLVRPAAQTVAGHPIDHHLSLWHGFTPMLFLSLLTLILGIVLFRFWDSLRPALARVGLIDRWGPDRGYDRVIAGLQRLALWQTHLLQTGSLRTYVGRVLMAIAIAGGVTLFFRGGFAAPSFGTALATPEVALALLLMVASLAVGKARHFITGIVAAGMVGFAAALLFLFQGAPDLAFTQFSVEALAIVILLAIVGRLPFRERDYRTKSQRLRDLLVAAGFGSMTTLFLLSVLAVPFDERLSDFFRQSSVPQAHGRNLVNVIIVDFRSLDTLGEITVLSLAALAAAAVIVGRRRQTPDNPP